jgi:hypothetical protein
VLAFGELLDTAVRATRRHFTAIYPGVAIPLALSAGTMVVLQLRVFRVFLPGSGQAIPGLADLLGGLLSFALAFLVYLTVYSLGAMAMLAAAVASVTGRELPIARAWMWTLRPRVAWTMLLWVAAIGAGTLLCIIPGIWVALMLALVIPVMVAEELTGGPALARSRALMRHNPERRLATHPVVKFVAISLVGGLVSYAASLAVTLPLAAVQQIMMFRTILTSQGAPTDPAALFSSWWMWLQVPQTVLGTLATTAVSLYVSTAVALLYVDLRNRKEGRDLDAWLDELGAPELPQESA